MATYKVVKLKSLTPLHIGTGRENYDFSSSELHSDVISSALAAMYAQQNKGEKVYDFLDSFALSSAFPFWKGFYFFPKMQGRLNVKIEGKEEHEYRKKLKNIKFIEFSIWNKLIKGECVTVQNEQVRGNFVIPTTLISDEFDKEKIFISQVNERVTVARGDNGNATPFFFDWKYFSKDGGLFFLTQFNTSDNSIETKFNDALSLLSEYGIGTDKNVGGGHFDFDTDEIELSESEDADKFLLLSNYIPSKDEFSKMNINSSKYELILRNGFIAGSDNPNLRHLRKKSVYVFKTGSIISSTETPKGKIVNLRPEWNDIQLHDVYRSGKPICIKIKEGDL